MSKMTNNDICVYHIRFSIKLPLLVAKR